MIHERVALCLIRNIYRSTFSSFLVRLRLFSFTEEEEDKPVSTLHDLPAWDPNPNISGVFRSSPLYHTHFLQLNLASRRLLALPISEAHFGERGGGGVVLPAEKGKHGVDSVPVTKDTVIVLRKFMK